MCVTVEVMVIAVIMSVRWFCRKRCSNLDKYFSPSFPFSTLPPTGIAGGTQT